MVQGKAGKMKSHPGAAPFHVVSEGLALARDIGPGIQKNHHLAVGKELRVEIVPIGRGLVGEVILGGHFGKEAVGFMHKADVRQIFFARVEGDGMKAGNTLRPAATAPQKADK